MIKRYNSEAKQSKLIDEVKEFLIDDYILKTKKESEGLQMLARRIETRIPQCLTVNSPEKDMKEAFYYAI